MSKTTELLEAAVAETLAHRSVDGQIPSPRQRAAIDHAFARVLKIIAPRIRHFIKQYGLTNHWEDAEQVCAIAVHRAIEAYDPAKAMFTTFVNWQIRGELQGLRFRLMDDQRPSARKVDAITVSLHGMEYGPDGEEMSLESMLLDENAWAGTEAAAADHLAAKASEALMEEYVRHLRSIGIAQLKRKTKASRTIAPRETGNANLPKYVHSRASGIDADEIAKLEERIERDRDIVARHLFAYPSAHIDPLDDEANGLTKERIRQITRRAARVMSELASGNPRFALNYRDDDHTAADIFPASGQPHNRMVSVSDPEYIGEDVLLSGSSDEQTITTPSRLRH